MYCLIGGDPIDLKGESLLDKLIVQNEEKFHMGVYQNKLMSHMKPEGSSSAAGSERKKNSASKLNSPRNAEDAAVQRMKERKRLTKQKYEEALAVLKGRIRKFKSKLKDFEYQKAIRYNVETARLLCDLVNRREKMKMSMELLNQSTFEREVNLVIQNTKPTGNHHLLLFISKYSFLFFSPTAY